MHFLYSSRVNDKNARASKLLTVAAFKTATNKGIDASGAKPPSAFGKFPALEPSVSRREHAHPFMVYDISYWSGLRQK